MASDAELYHTQDYRLISHSYTIKPEIIGTGYYGKVLLGHNRYNPEIKVAIKSLEKSKMVGGDIKQVKNEIQVLSRLDHPNICKYFETYESPTYIYLVMEYCAGGDLFSRLTSRSVS
jgi:serine/threonine protein kinase